MKYIKVSWPESQKFSDMDTQDDVYTCVEEDRKLMPLGGFMNVN